MTHKRSRHILHGAVISTIILIMQMFAALVKVKVILFCIWARVLLYFPKFKRYFFLFDFN